MFQICAFIRYTKFSAVPFIPSVTNFDHNSQHVALSSLYMYTALQYCVHVQHPFVLSYFVLIRKRLSFYREFNQNYMDF
jgi:hypothetical protein